MKEETLELSKDFLEILEDLREEHNANFYKLFMVFSDLQKELKEKHDVFLPLTSFLNMADYFDEKKYSYLRKRVLDKANDIIRKKK